MAKCGDAVSLTLNGTKFAIPKDTEPVVIDGGLKITETQEYGDGTGDSYMSYVLPKITGLRVKVPASLEDAWQNACSTPDIPIILETISRTYELTGSIIGGEAEISTTRNMTNEFEVHCTDGTGIRKS